MRLVSAFLLLSLLAACGSGKKKDQTATPQAATAPTSSPTLGPTAEDRDEPIELRRNYNGPALTLVANRESLGWIQLDGDDSAALFAVLRRQEQVAPAEQGWMEGRIKTGRHVHCVLRAPRLDPGAGPRATCLLALHYRLGTFHVQRGEGPVADARAVDAYRGPNLELDPARARVTLSGRDARMLYWALLGEPVASGGLEWKRGGEIACSRKPAGAPDTRYGCSLTMDLSGAVRGQEES